MTTRDLTFTLALALLALLTASCNGPRAKGVLATPDAGATVEPFPAAAVRLHPLTRLIPRAERGSVLEARFEMVDRFGVPTRSLGAAVFILESRAGETRWEIDLAEPQANATSFYDGVTRLYAVPLSTNAEPPPGESVLRLLFVTLDGRRLTSEMRLER